ncbi:proliferating cell nuclear antigen (pcna) [Infirmifilum sp. NZ]|uniref:proliferating cell nuclear antigen (pcna) n=1 Tax=Infirmifilum sp. NZ TaxID=2926850 RepID=UPI0027A75EA6|nr:proliferating cell nuclear antigen (pcna) [Infirmifilum sp. NZ]UNQ72787.1 proliferating cell nuclear antigen (pcna) [Infirmifilum sp. NZ]
MVRFTFPDAREWRYIIESLATIVDEANFVATPEGLTLRALDPGRIAMVDLYMPAGLFEEYSVEAETKIGVVLDDVNKVLKRAKSDDKLIFEVGGGRLTIILQGRAERRFRFPLLDIAGQELPTPKLNFTVAAKMLSDTFRDALKDASLVSESVRLKAEDETLYVSARSDKGEIESKFTIEAGSLLEIDVKEQAEASYGIDFLEKIVSKAYRVSDIMTLKFATNMPLEMTFDIAGGGTLKYLLAPRME